MPVSYAIDKQARVVLSRAFGVVTEAHMVEHRTSLRTDPDFDPSFNQLYDLRDIDVEASDISSEFIQNAARNTYYSKGARRAFVTATDVSFGLSRMFQIISEQAGVDVRVFRDLEEARAWLGMQSEG